jgi:predicted AlkP superfamily pyrophosphatase or phosphodiesterase
MKTSSRVDRHRAAHGRCGDRNILALHGREIAFWLACLCLLGALLPGHAEAAPRPIPGQPTPRPKPLAKLLVVIVLDNFRADYLTRFAPYFGPRGFQRLQQKGASLTGHYGQYVTFTASGHALILSGSYPASNGIGANRNFNQRTHEFESAVADPEARALGASEGPGADLSPRNLLGSTVGDELVVASGGQSKVVTLAMKGRAAILLGGHKSAAFWYDEATGEMTSSTYYFDRLPEWVSRFNAGHPADRYFGQQWERVLPAEAYRATPDDQEGEIPVRDFGRTFPHPLTGGLTAPGPRFYALLPLTPQANALEFAFAQAAVEAEQLGQRGVTDLLGISLSAPDYVAHSFGPFSHEAQDMAVRADRQIGEFLDWLEARLGRDAVVVLVTSDHGSAPLPEHMRKQGIRAGRIPRKALLGTIEAALVGRFGAGPWIVAAEEPYVHLDRARLTAQHVDPEAAERVAAEAARTVEGVSGAFPHHQLARGEVPATPLGQAVLRSFHAARAGDLFLTTDPYYIWGPYGDRDGGTTHGTAHRYDSEVPVLLLGPGVVPGWCGEREMVDLAPTLSHLLGLATPAAAEGQILPCVR